MMIMKSGAQDLYNLLYWKLGDYRLSTSFNRLVNTGADRFMINIAVNSLADEILAHWSGNPTFRSRVNTLPERPRPR